MSLEIKNPGSEFSLTLQYRNIKPKNQHKNCAQARNAPGMPDKSKCNAGKISIGEILSKRKIG